MSRQLGQTPQSIQVQSALSVFVLRCLVSPALLELQVIVSMIYDHGRHVRTIFDLCWIKVATHPSQFLALKIPQSNIALIEPGRDE